MLGEKIKSMREQKNMTQNELAKKLNLSKTTVSNYENNFRTPDIETLIRMCDVFKVSLDFIIGRTDYPFILEEEFKERNIVEILDIIKDNPEIGHMMIELLEVFNKYIFKR